MREVSLGLVIVLSLLALGTMIFLTGELPWERKGHTLITARFDYVGGLKEGDAVRVAGVKVGKVLSISIGDDGVYVVMMLSPEVRLRKGSLFTIGTAGIVGEKYVEIIPQFEGEPFKPGEKVEGISPYRFEELLGELRLSIQRFGRVMDEVEKLIGDEAFRRSIKEGTQRLNEVLEEAKESLEKFKVAASNIDEKASKLMDELRLTVSENRKDIKALVENLRLTSERLRDFASRFATPENVQMLEETLLSIKKAAEEISSLARGFSESDINRTVEDVKFTVEETKRVVERIKTLKVEGGARFRYGKSSFVAEEEGFTDVWFRLELPNEQDSLFVAIDDLGGENEFSFLLEKKIGRNFSHKFGVIRGEPGYAIFHQASPRFSWEFALRNVKEFELDLSLWYRLFYSNERKLFLFSRFDYQSGELRPSIGIEYRF
ncbi:MAG: MlaD family protein [Synergistetes bacterium]|nr:MlaD family protein [Synergistota bacterium]